MKTRVLLAALALTALALPALEPVKLLRQTWGNAALHEGARGEVDTTGEFPVLTKTADGGYLLWGVHDNSLVPIVPGKRYEATAVMELKGPVSATLMLSMPSGKRTPFPTDTIRKSGTAAIRFSAGADETTLRPHIVLRGTGTVVVKDMLLKPLPDTDPTQLAFDADDIQAAWELQNPVKKDYTKNGLAGQANGQTRISSGPLQWDASKVRALEADIAFHPEGGSLILMFDGIHNGKRYSASMRRTFIPSGNIRTVLFDLSSHLQWRGTITRLSFQNELDMESDFQLTGIRALAEPNLIPDARRRGPKEIELVRPGAEYELRWAGPACGSVAIKMLDAEGRAIQSIALDGRNSAARTFTTPMNTVSAIAVVLGGNGYPVLSCKGLPATNTPEIYWQSSWMWFTATQEPYDIVTFDRDFTLPSPPKRAEIRYLADDAGEYDINGHTFKDNAVWHISERQDITAMLHAGANHVNAKVNNITGGGGLLFELYAELQNGQVFSLGGDKEWRCTYNGTTIAPVLLGIPPRAASWSDRIDCQYIGPRFPAQLKDLTASSFQARPEAPLPDYGSVSLTIRSDTGAERRIPIAVTPRTGAWTPGKWTSVAFQFDDALAAGLPGTSFTLILQPDFLAVASPARFTLPPRSSVPADFPTTRIANAGRRPWIEVDGRRIPPFYFDLPFNFIKVPLSKAHFVENAARAGASIVRIWYGLRDFWLAPDTYDFDRLDFAIAVIRSRMPDAHIIVNCATYMPDWWLAANPDSRIKWFKNDQPFPGYYQSLGSLKFLRDAPVGLRRLVGHLHDSGNAKNVIGIVVSDGGTNEWMWQNEPYGSHYWAIHSGNSPSDHTAFQQFLKDKYGDDAPKGMTMPHCDRWYEHGEGIFLDPEKQRDVIEFFDFRNLAVSRDIRTFAKAIKDASGRRLLSGAYYGYLIMFSRRFDQFQASGHLRLHDVASCGDCDLFFAPTMYGWRFPGEADSLMQPAEAITAHGALPIAEFDYRTYTEPANTQMMNGGADSVATTFSLIDKGFGMALVRAAGGHWMELHERWFREPIIVNHLKKLLDFYKNLPPLPAGTTTRDLCVVSDERSAIRTPNNKGDGAHRAIIAEVCRTLPWSGAAYNHILLEDFLTPGLIHAHKFYIFTNALELDDAKRHAIKKRLQDEKAHALWLYAPGAVKPGQKIDADGIRDMTGIKVRRTDDAIALDWESTPQFGGKTRLAHLTTAPNFLPEGGYDTVVATSGDTPVAVAKHRHGRIDYFSAALVPQEDALRIMLQTAGVHIYQKDMDVLYAGNDFVIIHAITDGTKQLLLPKGTTARQFLGRTFTLDPKAPRWQAKAAETFGFIIEK